MNHEHQHYNHSSHVTEEHKHSEHQYSKGGEHSRHNHSEHHAHMIEDFRKRFWISLVVSIPVLFLSPMIQHFLGIREAISFNGEAYLLFAFSSFIFFYGGWPFLKGLIDELKNKQPGMMTLISLAISVALIQQWNKLKNHLNKQ